MSAEQIFSAKQVSERLGLSAAMTRRYGAALEEITGEAIRQHPRDGRQYRADQVNALLRAKGYLEANPRLSVPQALATALRDRGGLRNSYLVSGTAVGLPTGC